MEATVTITAWKDNKEVKSEKEEPDTYTMYNLFSWFLSTHVH